MKGEGRYQMREQKIESMLTTTCTIFNVECESRRNQQRAYIWSEIVVAWIVHLTRYSTSLCISETLKHKLNIIK